MSTLLEQRLDSFVMPPFPVRRWTVAEYRHLAEIGALTEEDQVELLEGWIVPKMTKNPPHEWTVTRVYRTLDRAVGEEWVARAQCAINTADSEPEPAGSVVRGPEDRYALHHPRGTDIGLVIEVADAAVQKDRRKAAIYAAEGIPWHWLINLVERQIEVHSDPDSAARRYRNVQSLSSLDAIELVLDDQHRQSIPVETFLPPQE